MIFTTLKVIEVTHPLFRNLAQFSTYQKNKIRYISIVIIPVSALTVPSKLLFLYQRLCALLCFISNFFKQWNFMKVGYPVGNEPWGAGALRGAVGIEE